LSAVQWQQGRRGEQLNDWNWGSWYVLAAWYDGNTGKIVVNIQTVSAAAAAAAAAVVAAADCFSSSGGGGCSSSHAPLSVPLAKGL